MRSPDSDDRTLIDDFGSESWEYGGPAKGHANETTHELDGEAPLVELPSSSIDEGPYELPASAWEIVQKPEAHEDTFK